MTTQIDKELQGLAEELELLGDWEERYSHLIDLGRGLDPLGPDERGEVNKVRGCASQVWLVTEAQGDKSLRIRGDSDSSLVRGLIAILIRLYSERSVDDIVAFEVKAGFETLGFASAISAQRSNGFFAMVQRVRRDAEAIKAAA